MNFKRIFALSSCLTIAVALLAAWSDAGSRSYGQSEKFEMDPLFSPLSNFMIHRLDATDRNELRCLALNIYWESRSEPVEGQLAVAAVTLNRVASELYPDDICGVVRQGGETRRHKCQFSWWCDGKADEPLDAQAWQRAMTLSRLAASGVVSDPTQGALWYHADYVNPYWSKRFGEGYRIGRHIFYGGDTAIEVTENGPQETASTQ